MGLVEIRARSGEAVSEPLQFDVLIDSNELAVDGVKQLVSTLDVSAIQTRIPIEITPTSEILAEVAVVNTLVPVSSRETTTVIDVSEMLDESIHIDPRDLMSAILAMIVIGTIGWSLASMRGMMPLLNSRV